MKKLITSAIVFVLCSVIFVGCRGSLNSADSFSKLKSAMDNWAEIETEINGHIRNMEKSEKLAADFEFVSVSALGGPLHVSVELKITTVPDLKEKYFAEEVQEIVPIIVKKLNEDGISPFEISVLARDKQNKYDSDGILSYRTKDGATGTYASSIDEQQILKVNVPIEDLYASETETVEEASSEAVESSQAAASSSRNVTSSKKTQDNSSGSEVSEEKSSSKKDNDSNATGRIYGTPNGKKYHYLKSCGGKNSREISSIGSRKPCNKCVR